MAANPNTQTLKQVWMDAYQLTHYKQPVFRAIVEEKMLTGMLKKGDTINWSYMSDFYVENMGADGSYNTQAQADTNETLVINQVKDTSFYEFQKDLEQAHYNVKMEYAKKAMNKVFLQIDSDVLVAAYLGASTVVDAGTLATGTASGVPIVTGITNVAALFAACNLTLTLNNVIYDPNLTFTKEVKLEKVTGMPVAIISAQVYQSLILYLGGKTTVLGDKVSVSGHAGAFMSFNLFVSNQLPSSFALGLATQPSDGDTFTINGLTFTFKTTLGSTAGNILIGGSAAVAQANLTALLAAPFTTTTNGVSQTNSVANQNKLANITVGAFTSNVANVYQGGIGTMVVTIGQNTAANVWGGTANTAGTQVGGVTSGTVKVVQHNIIGVSKSVGLCLQHEPSLYVNPVSGKVGKDYVTWTFYGTKVFKYMTTQLIDVQVDASAFTQPNLVAN